MKTLVASACAALLAAASANAQAADPSPYRGDFAMCLSRPDATPAEAYDCIGKVAQACMEEEEGGFSTYGMTACMMMENGLWDNILNAEWQVHMAAARAQDEAERPYHDGAFADAKERLLAAQRAWIAFRDADCSAASASWGSGSMRHIEFASCMLDHTARRVLTLRAQWEKF